MKTTAIIMACLGLGIGLSSAMAAAPTVPAGSYTIDRAHATLLFRVDHLGFSKYTACFKKFDAALQLTCAPNRVDRQSDGRCGLLGDRLPGSAQAGF